MYTQNYCTKGGKTHKKKKYKQETTPPYNFLIFHRKFTLI